MGAFRRFAWANLAVLFLVIAWGAFVRATGSGAGCGDHWPTCNGVLIPRAPSAQTIIEFTHRVTSGLAGLLVLLQLGWGLWAFPKKHPVRGPLWATTVFLVLEAAIGAGLVLFEWVAHDVSVARALSMAVHLLNTFLLLFAQTMVCFYAAFAAKPAFWFRRLKEGLWVNLGLLGILVSGLSGTVAALGDTLLFVSVPLGKVQESNVLLQTLLQLRVSHPLLAIVASFAVWTAAARLYQVAAYKRLAAALAALVGGQLFLGMWNVILKAPVWLQLTHLLLADALWVLLTWAGLSLLARGEGEAPASLSEARHVAV